MLVWLIEINITATLYFQINCRSRRACLCPAILSRHTFKAEKCSFNKSGERGGGKIPGARSAQRGPEISVKCSYIVYHRQFPE
jgi:hypothetical protein